MNLEELVARYPKLYHMSEAGSWDSIQQHGLLSTSALLDLFEIDSPQRDNIESQLRLESISIEHPVHGQAVIRDQCAMCDKPWLDIYLEDCLDGITPQDWCRFLNGKTFFWVDTQRLIWMLSSTLYKGRAHWVITVYTRDMLERHAEQVTLSNINTGSIWRAESRGYHTFKPIRDYHYYYVAELAVDHSVPDIADLALSVTEWEKDRQLRVIWQRASA